MHKYIAFLRAINVGGRIVKMEALRKIFSDMGFTSVETFIASGNVIFEASESDLQAMVGLVNMTALESWIEDHLHEALGYTVKTFVRTPARLEEIAGYRPFTSEGLANAAHTLYIGFLHAPPAPDAIQKVSELGDSHNRLQIHDRELYWLVHNRISESAITGARLEKALGMPTTLRNWNTVQKLADKVA